MNIKFEMMLEKDIINLSVIMKRAFNYDRQIHLGERKGDTVRYNGNLLKKWVIDKKTTSYCIYLDNLLIGATVIYVNDNYENELECLFIDPNYEDRGIGTEVWKMIERMYPKTKKWNAETPIFSRKNHNFYVNKCGFHVTKIKSPKDLDEGSFILEKVI